MRRFIPALARSSTLLVAALLVASPGIARQHLPHPVKKQPVAEQKAPLARPALWKLSDSDTTIYLFGTIHALPAGIDWLKGPVAKAMASSETLVTEIPDTDTATLQAVVGKIAFLPAGKSLRDMLTPDDRAKLDKALKDAGMAPTALDPFKPWYAGITLPSFPLMKQGYTAANGVEAQLTARNKALGHAQEGLETAAMQLGLFDSLPQAMQVRYLHNVLKNLPAMGKELDQLVHYWSAGDADRLAALMNKGDDDPALVKILLVNRNRNWAKWIASRMDKPGVIFMAVGAGHLAGRNSVQAQLATKGLRVTRVQ